MIKLYQANSTLLVSFEKNDQLNMIDLKHLINVIVLKLKSPFSNIMLDMKGIEKIDKEGIRLLEVSKKISEINESQINIFNVSGNLMTQIKESKLNQNFFFCDHLSIAS